MGFVRLVSDVSEKAAKFSSSQQQQLHLKYEILLIQCLIGCKCLKAACARNHGNRGIQIIKMAHSKNEVPRVDLCRYPEKQTTFLTSCRLSYQLSITLRNIYAMLPF